MVPEPSHQMAQAALGAAASPPGQGRFVQRPGTLRGRGRAGGFSWRVRHGGRALCRAPCVSSRGWVHTLGCLHEDSWSYGIEHPDLSAFTFTSF